MARKPQVETPPQEMPAPRRAPLGALFEQFALIGHAVSSPHRLKMIQLLAQAPRDVETLADMTGQSVASASAHLKVLRATCLVESDRNGRHVVYRLASDEVLAFWLALRDLGARQLPEAREMMRVYFDDPESLATFQVEELITAAREGRIILLDVRPAEEYAAGHLPHARSVPLETLRDAAASLPKRKPVVIYCRGPFCVTALEALDVLRSQGIAARRVKAGVAEWRTTGVPLERA